MSEVLSEMGLTDAQNTLIGNWYLKGISGGQVGGMDTSYRRQYGMQPVPQGHLRLDLHPIPCKTMAIFHWRVLPAQVHQRCPATPAQKRRLAIACELVTHPTLLFLDEPTSGEKPAVPYIFIASLMPGLPGLPLPGLPSKVRMSWAPASCRHCFLPLPVLL